MDYQYRKSSAFPIPGEVEAIAKNYRLVSALRVYNVFARACGASAITIATRQRENKSKEAAFLLAVKCAVPRNSWLPDDLHGRENIVLARLSDFDDRASSHSCTYGVIEIPSLLGKEICIQLRNVRDTDRYDGVIRKHCRVPGPGACSWIPSSKDLSTPIRNVYKVEIFADENL